MKKWMAAFFSALILAIIPSPVFASSVNAWEEAEPVFLIVMSIISIASLLLFIYLMIRDNG